MNYTGTNETGLYDGDSAGSCENSTELHDFVFGIEVAVPPWEAFATAIVLGIVILVTIVGNVLVILSVFNYRPLRIAQNFFIVSLAVADLTVALLVLPFNVAYYIMNKWMFGIHLCKMWLTSDVLCCTASILNLCAIALDRYWAITDPINYARKRTVRRVTIMIAITWVLSAIISSPPLLGWNNWPTTFDDSTPCKLNSDRGYVIYSSSGSFYIPLLIMTIVYVQIFIATRRRLRERARASKLNAVKEILSSKKEHLQHLPIEAESVSSELTNCVPNNSFRSKTKGRKGKKRCKHKSKCSQHSLLVPNPQPEESLSDVASISPGKGTSSEGTEPAADGKPPEKPEDECAATECAAVAAAQREGSSFAAAAAATAAARPPAPPKKSVFVHQFIEEKQRISLSKERKAARTLGIIMGVFVFCWLPFFLMYVIEPFCPSCCLSRRTTNIITWLGYINSALNPIIYTIFNIDFRKAFKKLLHLRQVS